MKCNIFLPVRTASTRLPHKVLLEIKNKPLIKILVERLSICKNIDKILVCTTTSSSDDKLCKFLKDNKIEVYRGSETNIINRLYTAALQNNVKQFVVVEGDDIFCEPDLVDKTCEILSNSNFDFICWEKFPFGVSPLGIRTDKLGKLASKELTKNTDTGWGKFIVESGLFKVHKLEPDDERLIRPEIRLSIDYEEDFELAKKIFENLGSSFTLIEILKLLDENPNWLEINKDARKKYEQNFEKKRVKLNFKEKNI